MRTERRTVYIVEGKTFLTRSAAYRREALLELLRECAETCEWAVDDPESVPSVEACSDCHHRPASEAITRRAGEVFARDNAAKGGDK